LPLKLSKLVKGWFQFDPELGGTSASGRLLSLTSG
jgi:hypothetical protein